MSASTLLPSSLDSTPGRTLAGHWKLPAGRALSLHPRERGVLEITLGRVWLTMPDGAGASVDHVLSAGECLVVEPGRHVVVEPWAGAGWPAVAFRWDVAVAQQACATPVPAADWEHGVAQPTRELARSLVSAGQAAVRVLAGLWGWAGLATQPAGRGRVPCGGG